MEFQFHLLHSFSSLAWQIWQHLEDLKTSDLVSTARHSKQRSLSDGDVLRTCCHASKNILYIAFFHLVQQGSKSVQASNWTSLTSATTWQQMSLSRLTRGFRMKRSLQVNLCTLSGWVFIDSDSELFVNRMKSTKACQIPLCGSPGWEKMSLGWKWTHKRVRITLPTSWPLSHQLRSKFRVSRGCLLPWQYGG